MEGPTILSKVPESVEERKVCFCSETAVAHCTAKLHSKATQTEGDILGVTGSVRDFLELSSI